MSGYFSKKTFPMHFSLDKYTHYPACIIAKVAKVLGEDKFPMTPVRKFGPPLKHTLHSRCELGNREAS